MAATISIQEVKSKFQLEFASIADKFSIIEMDNNPLSQATSSVASNPGVYVFWHPTYGVVKVGRSLDNSLKRAREHYRDNTSGGEPPLKMKVLESDPDTRLVLFNLRNRNDLHWAAALEVFFEQCLKPHVPSGRIG